MTISYDDIISAFLAKITEFELMELYEDVQEATVTGYMKRAIVHFKESCQYDLSYDDELRELTDDFDSGDVDEILEIISDGMVVQWLKPFYRNQELLENAMTTRDYEQYSTGNLLQRVGGAYEQTKSEYIQEIREYSYVHGDLTDLHL